MGVLEHLNTHAHVCECDEERERERESKRSTGLRDLVHSLICLLSRLSERTSSWSS